MVNSSTNLRYYFRFIWMVIILQMGVFGFEDCPVKFARVGCYRDRAKNPRPLTELLMTDRDAKSHAYSGQKTDWNNWNEYLPNLACRCAKKAKDKGYNVFGLQDYGECWSDFNGEGTYFKDGRSDQCVTFDSLPCEADEAYCVGKIETNFVYGLNETSTTPTTKPTTGSGGHSAGATSPARIETTEGASSKLSALNCQNYLSVVRLSKSIGPTLLTLNTPSTITEKSAVFEKVINIYKGDTCLNCLKTVNASSSAMFLMLQFTCQGQHLKKLVAGLGASNIIKAECHPRACNTSAHPCPSPCGIASCPMSPTMAYPPLCPVSVPQPASLPPPQ